MNKQNNNAVQLKKQAKANAGMSYLLEKLPVNLEESALTQGTIKRRCVGDARQLLSAESKVIDFTCYVHTENKKYVPVRIIASRLPEDKALLARERKMRNAKKYQTKTSREGRYCPKCGSIDNQSNFGKNRSGTQRCKCNECEKTYTLNPKTRAIPEEVRQQAIKTYYSGASGRGVGKLLGMNKSNVCRWIKKTK